MSSDSKQMSDHINTEDSEARLQNLQAHYSNERTFLSYVRTAASVIVLAVGFLKFFSEGGFKFAGWVCFVLGLAILILGVFRYGQEKQRINRHASAARDARD